MSDFFFGVNVSTPHPTSRSVFRGGYQVTVVLGLSSSGTHIPLAYAVMPNRQARDYLPLFEALRDLGVQPQSVMTDFEAAIEIAARTVWPKANARKCLFHLLQTVRRWLQKNCRASVDSAVRKRLEGMVQKMAKAATVAEFQEALTELISWKLVSIQGFVEYFVRTFIERISPTQWAYCYAKSAEERLHVTNNAAER